MNQLEQLTDFILSRCSSGAALAFSGGIDSTLLLAVLSRCRKEKNLPVLAVTAASVLQSEKELTEIRQLAAGYDVPLELVWCDLLGVPEIRSNTPERCYHCKRFIFENMLRKAAEHGFSVMIEGTHADDLKSYRPGVKALKELGIVSPLAELGIGKAGIRTLSAELQIKNAFKPSSPCLATRFPYGTALEEDRIVKTGAGEEFLRTLLPENADLRLRVHGDLARIEVPVENMAELCARREEIITKLRELGFFHITLDLAGFCSGSGDRKLLAESDTHII